MPIRAPAPMLTAVAVIAAFCLSIWALPSSASASGASSGQAQCRSPQDVGKKPGEMFAYNSSRGQADEWAAWMSEQVAQGRSNFIVVPIKKVMKDQGEVQDNPTEVVCAW